MITIDELEKSVNLEEYVKKYLEACRKEKKTTHIIFGDGEKDYEIDVKDGNIIRFEETTYDDEEYPDDEEEQEIHIMEQNKRYMLAKAITEASRNVCMIQKNPTHTAIQLKEAREALTEAQNKAISELASKVGAEYLANMLIEATEKGQLLAIEGAEQVDRLIIYYEELGRREAAKEQNAIDKSI